MKIYFEIIKNMFSFGIAENWEPRIIKYVHQRQKSKMCLSFPTLRYLRIGERSIP